MKTKPIMLREFYDSHVCQRTSDGFFNATEFLKRFNELTAQVKELRDFWKNKGTEEFIKALETELLLNVGNSPQLAKTHQMTRGKKGSTWMHPYLFVKFAMWLSPALEVKIIKWVYDNLIEFRLLAGDHYKEMCDAIALRYFDYYKRACPPDVFIQEAHILNNLVFGNPHGNQRNTASEAQLDLMNRLQVANTRMIRDGISRSKREQNLITFRRLYLGT